MSRGNDAIPTWSGFNYQGKIMLFYILKLINQINKEKDGRTYSVNLEGVENFCILCDYEYISFHQVKAWLSVTKWSSYSAAMDKLLKHRNSSSNPMAKCYLMTARDICEDSLEDCSRVCAAKAAYEKIMEISDYTKFCKALNPDKIDGWDNSLAMAENFPVKGLQNEIYYLLYQSKSPEKILGDGNGICLQSKYSNAPNGKIIPTLLDLTSGCRGKRKALQRIFQNIIQNADIMDILEGNSITVIPGSYNGFLS